MGPDEVGAAVPEETATNTITNTDQDAGRSQSTNGDGAGDSREGITWDGRQSEQDARAEFVVHLLGLNVPLWVAERNPRGPDGAEFTRPRGWPTLTAAKNIERLSTFSPGKAICANTGGKVAVVDVDPRNGGDIEKVRALLDELGVRIYGELHTHGDGRHFYVQGHPELPSVHSTAENNRLPGYPGVDIQSFACNVFLPCTERPKYQGKGYTVVFDDLQVLATEGDPEGGEALAQWVAEQTYKAARRTVGQRKDSADFEFELANPWTGGKPDARQQGYLDKVLEENAKKVATSKPGERNDTLYRAALKCGSYIAGAGMDMDTVTDALQLAAIDCGLTDEDGEWSVLATIRSAFRTGFTNARAVPDHVPASDKSNAMQLVAEYGHTIHFVPEISKWVHWNGVLWHFDPDTGPIDTAAGQIAIGLPQSTNEEQKHRKQSLSARGITAMVRLARSDPMMRVSRDRLDASGWQLNTPNGIVDLRTGEIGDHRPEAWHTRITRVGYDPRGDCPLWKTFLDTTFEGDKELISYVQGLFGYAAIGEVLSHILSFFWGAGNNGKSVLLEVVCGILGDYAITAPANFLLAGRDRHETEIARLSGARLVVCSEINQGTQFDEAKVKLLTGGDTLTGRFMYGNFFDFRPSHTLFLVGNHQPTVGAGGHAFWRRVRLVPFTHQVPEGDRVEGLADRLIEAEGPAILGWIVDGARMAAAGQLITPRRVLAATEEYQESEDRIKQFLDDCTARGTREDRELVGAVYQRYVEWCNARRIRDVLEDSVFGREISSRGFEKSRSDKKRYVHGLKLNPTRLWTQK